MKKYLSIFVKCLLLFLYATTARANVQEEIIIMKKVAQEKVKLFEKECGECVLFHYENTIDNKEFQRRIGQCLEVEADNSISLNHAGELAQCMTLRLRAWNESVDNCSVCHKPYQKKLDW